MKTLFISIWALFLLAFMALMMIGVVTGHPIYIKPALVIGGFLFYNVLVLSFKKDEHDETGSAFPLYEYSLKTWDNWLLNWLGACLLLLLGQEVMGIINFMEDKQLTWSDSYYAGSGFIVQVIIDRWKAYKKR